MGLGSSNFFFSFSFAELIFVRQIKQKLKDYDVEGVEHITLVLDTQNEGLSRGFAFLEFSCHQDAMLAYKRLQKPDVIFGHPERTAKVAFAEPLREPDPEVMAQVLLQMHPSAPCVLLLVAHLLLSKW